MKKIFTLLTVLMTCGTIGWAQDVDNTFQFTDMEGNVVTDGSVITVNTTTKNESGELLMVVPLKVKNVSGEKAAVSMYEVIDQKPNGGWQTCAFGNCMQLTGTGYSPKNIMTADYHADIQTEWIPQEGAYATWEATLQIHVFNIVTKTMFGQVFESAGDEIIGYGPKVTVRFEYKEQQEQGGQTGTLIMGPTLSDEVASGDYGSGFGRYATGLLSVFNMLSADELAAFDGKDIVKVRVGLAEAATISRVIIYALKDNNVLTDNPILDQKVSDGQAGWNEFELDSPVTLNLTGLQGIFLGFEYNQTAGGWPLSVLEGSHPLYVYGNLGQGEGFYSAGAGDLSIQCYVQGDFEPKDIMAQGIYTDGQWFKPGEEMDFAVSVLNFGTAQIDKYSFDVEIDDAVVSTVESDEPLASMASGELEGTVTLAKSLAFGSHKLGLRLKSVDGEAPAGNTNNDYVSTTFNVYEQSVPRQKNLLEQFTSQYCTYCPRGVTFFSDLISQRDDIAWVSIHGDMSSGSDIFTIAAGDSISYYEGVTGFPSASFNRTYVRELADSEGEIAYGLGYSMEMRTQVVSMFSGLIDYTAEAPSFVKLTVNQVYNAETKQLSITVNGEGVENAAKLLADYGVNVLITENGIKARQLNEGRWVSAFDHHYVLRAVLGKCTGNAISWQGNNFTATFTYDVPDEYNRENMYVVAFVAPMVDFESPNTMNMAVNNCEMVAVKDAEASAIRTVGTDSEPQSYYSLDGRQLQAGKKGLTIIRMADGTARKVVVRK